MSEPPDFDQLAGALVTHFGSDVEVGPIQHGLMVEGIAEQLRLIWNARGAADLNALDRLMTAAGWTERNQHRQQLRDAIHALNRAAADDRDGCNDAGL